MGGVGITGSANTRAAWQLVRTDRPAVRTERHHCLKGELAHGTHRGQMNCGSTPC
ncbi:hypothetical protein [Streptomyces sp. FIT100]|uniref:hypothetical protein n=1 Tax=Streptomyces sp. FIT100 TaxID=2837956 RepID=UPI0021CA2916|nr:hypothetical protein [Streptomyces sp. FIT100]UUN30665.1 hypothetical protein KK483_33280 [Streptomyces sp. FIT100]